MLNPNSFTPPPKVVSSILLIKKRSELLWYKIQWIFKGCIAKQQEKKLIKNLSLKYTKEHLQNIFEKMNIDQNIRPHQTEISVIRDYIKN